MIQMFFEIIAFDILCIPLQYFILNVLCIAENMCSQRSKAHFFMVSAVWYVHYALFLHDALNSEKVPRVTTISDFHMVIVKCDACYITVLVYCWHIHNS